MKSLALCVALLASLALSHRPCKSRVLDSRVCSSMRTFLSNDTDGCEIVAIVPMSNDQCCMWYSENHRAAGEFVSDIAAVPDFAKSVLLDLEFRGIRLREAAQQDFDRFRRLSRNEMRVVSRVGELLHDCPDSWRNNTVPFSRVLFALESVMIYKNEQMTARKAWDTLTSPAFHGVLENAFYKN